MSTAIFLIRFCLIRDLSRSISLKRPHTPAQNPRHTPNGRFPAKFIPHRDQLIGVGVKRGSVVDRNKGMKG